MKTYCKTNIEGTANIVNFCLAKVKKLCYISSTAALGDLASNETIITEEIEWNPENRTVIMLFLNMVPKWKSGEVSKNRCNNCKSRNWSWIPRTGKRPTFKEVANGLRYYTWGKEHSCG
jgi:hypothetical protein